MLIIPVNGNIERALKKYKNKYNRTGLGLELRQRQEYNKKSVKLREQKIKAIYAQKMKNQEE
jgi:small subunit ribosomal protein S21